MWVSFVNYLGIKRNSCTYDIAFLHYRAKYFVKLNLKIFVNFIKVPEENVATTKHGASVIVGEARQALLDGDTANYDMERGFTRHPIDDTNEK